MNGNLNVDPLLGRVVEQRPNSSPRSASPQDAITADPSVKEIASQAMSLRNMMGAGFMYWIVSSSMVDKPLDADAFRVYRDLLLEEAGNPKDPIERMLIEQLALAHFNIGRLHIRSCSMEVPKLALAFADAATRLLGEFRRSSLALEDYRAKQATRANANGSTDSTKTTTRPLNGYTKPTSNGNGKHHDSELRSNGNGKHHHTHLECRINGEVPAWLKKRMAFPTPNGSQPAAETVSNGKA